MPAYEPMMKRCVWLRPSVASMYAASPRCSGVRSTGRSSRAASPVHTRDSLPVRRPSLSITFRRQRP